MNYVAIELRVNNDNSFTVSTFKKTSREEAEKAFHSILSSAATSDTKSHGAIVLNEYGEVIRRPEYYKHDQPEQQAE